MGPRRNRRPKTEVWMIVKDGARLRRRRGLVGCTRGGRRSSSGDRDDARRRRRGNREAQRRSVAGHKIRQRFRVVFRKEKRRQTRAGGSGDTLGEQRQGEQKRKATQGLPHAAWRM